LLQGEPGEPGREGQKVKLHTALSIHLRLLLFGTNDCTCVLIKFNHKVL